MLIVEQGVQGTSYGAWLADEIQRRYFDHLDQPVQRVTGSEASPSISKVLERAAIAQTEEVVPLSSHSRGFGKVPDMAMIVSMPEVLAGANETAIARPGSSPGAAVVIGDPLAEIETDKAIVEVSAELDGWRDRAPSGRPGRHQSPSATRSS